MVAPLQAVAGGSSDAEAAKKLPVGGSDVLKRGGQVAEAKLGSLRRLGASGKALTGGLRDRVGVVWLSRRSAVYYPKVRAKRRRPRTLE